jgi:1-aminocyclopropane-1-carboxylate deaminase/D-cysteine desulfhydrase-like pyridoxal-dependent ACC family enzyme
MESTTKPRATGDKPSLVEMYLPSPVRLLAQVGPRASLWLKDDSHLHSVYGGNKCRKLVHILQQAHSRGTREVITFGAAGSHHVLATGLFASAWGFSSRAFLIPQPWSRHAQAVLRASVNSGIELVPVACSSLVLATTAACLASDCFLVAPGGSSLCGAMGYFEAALELADQVRTHQLPEPDLIVVAFGSTGTAAGLWAGIEHAGLKSKILAVSVLHLPGRLMYARRIAQQLLNRVRSHAILDAARLNIDSRWVGGGYGVETESARTAIDVGVSLDLPLDPTYTGKAFAAALALVIGDRIGSITPVSWPTDSPGVRNVLYWHTLSAMSPQSELANVNPIPGNLASLLRRTPEQQSA